MEKYIVKGNTIRNENTNKKGHNINKYNGDKRWKTDLKGGR